MRPCGRHGFDGRAGGRVPPAAARPGGGFGGDESRRRRVLADVSRRRRRRLSERRSSATTRPDGGSWRRRAPQHTQTECGGELVRKSRSIRSKIIKVVVVVDEEEPAARDRSFAMEKLHNKEASELHASATCRGRTREREKRTLTLNFGSAYYE